MRFIVLGSANPEIIKGVSESLAGRIAYLELSPFNLLELDGQDISIKDHHFYGGFPKVILEKMRKHALIGWTILFLPTFSATCPCMACPQARYKREGFWKCWLG